MKGIAGCRTVKVLSNVTSGDIGTPFVSVEVTNSNATDVTLYVNHFPEQGHATVGDPLQGIPIKAGTTREIPMIVYNFVATGAVTVVAYGQ